MIPVLSRRMFGPIRRRRSLYGLCETVKEEIMRTTLLTVAAGVAFAAAACHPGAAPATTLAPSVDSSALAERARQDSLARAEAEARAREAARLAAQRRADSVAALGRASEEAKATLASLIHFDFDKSAIRPGDAQVLDQKLPVLSANPTVRIRIAGNCDERGSDEYNLALGNRRAIQAKQYLVSHGVEANRIETVSYGKERPLDPAHTETAWAKNRNDEFEVVTTVSVLREP